jgi:hypothetical protein
MTASLLTARRLEARARSLQGPNRETERARLLRQAARIRTAATQGNPHERHA